MKEISTYQACKILQQKQLANLAMNSVYWSTRFDYLTIYEYMLAHYPERQRGYRSEIANSLSFSKLGGYFGLVDTTMVQNAIKTMESTVYI